MLLFEQQVQPQIVGAHHWASEGGVDGLELATTCQEEIQILHHRRALCQDVKDANAWATSPWLGVENGDFVDGI